MSPSEKDLRAALRRDEGDGLDPDAVIAAGRSRLTQRRGRVAAVSGTAVAVLAVATAAGVLLSRSGSDGQRSASRAAADAAGGKSAVGGSSSCPAIFPTRPATGPRLGSAADSLFASPVTSVVVCGYGSTGAGPTARPSTLALTGSDATRLVTSLDSAAASRPPGACPMYRVADDHRLVFLGVTAHGTVLAPVSTTLGNPACTVQVSNGSTVRYAWDPPTDLKSRIFALRPKR